MVMPAISIRAPRLGYPGREPVLSEVDLSVYVGERIALVGGNGAGKTTLLRALVGLLPGGCDVRTQGRRIASPKDAVAARICLVFQNPDDQLFGATVLEDVLFGPLNQGLDEQEASLRARRALEDMGVAALSERSIETLSFGEKKRVCLAGALAMRPSVMLLDEPTAGLDPLGELALIDLLGDLNRDERLTIIAATHAVDLVPRFAERVILLGGGGVLCDGPPHEVFARTEALTRARVRAPYWNLPPLAVGAVRT